MEKKRTLPAETLTRDEAVALFDACSRRGPAGIRNKALLATMYSSGLRVAEALSLRPYHVNFDTREIRVLNGKGGRSRTVPVIGYDCVSLIQRWLDVRRGMGINGKNYLFCTITDSPEKGMKKGSPLGTDYVRRMIKRMGERAEIEHRVHPHQLRHSFADELRRKGVSMPVIQKILGHSSLATTSRYLDHIGAVDLDEVRDLDWSLKQ